MGSSSQLDMIYSLANLYLIYYKIYNLANIQFYLLNLTHIY